MTRETRRKVKCHSCGGTGARGGDKDCYTCNGSGWEYVTEKRANKKGR